MGWACPYYYTCTYYFQTSKSNKLELVNSIITGIKLYRHTICGFFIIVVIFEWYINKK